MHEKDYKGIAFAVNFSIGTRLWITLIQGSKGFILLLFPAQVSLLICFFASLYSYSQTRKNTDNRGQARNSRIGMDLLARYADIKANLEADEYVRMSWVFEREMYHYHVSSLRELPYIESIKLRLFWTISNPYDKRNPLPYIYRWFFVVSPCMH